MRACAHARTRGTGRYANGKIFSQIPDGISIPKMYVLYNLQKTPVYDIVGWTMTKKGIFMGRRETKILVYSINLFESLIYKVI